jgi:transcriptional regulator with XRE-family HTH domain
MEMRVPEWTLGDRLRKVRRDAGLTVVDMAAALGVSDSQLAHYETDRARPRDLIGFATRVEVTYGVPAWWLLGLAAPTAGRPRTDQLPQVTTAAPLYVDVPLAPLFSEAAS